MLSRFRKNAAYIKYIAKHKWFVFVECAKLGILLRGLFHDSSKFLPDEWVPYREFFYGKKNEEGYYHKPGVKQDFDVAWLKHIHRNPHHWQFWLLRKDNGSVKTIEMPYVYVLEMVADWRGAGKAQGFDSVRDWYAKNKEKMHLHSDTRIHVEVLLRQFGDLD